MADRRARSRRGSRSASSPMSDLPDAEYEELANFHSKHELFDAIERGHSITLAAGAREKVAVTLLRYAERCFRRERRIAHEVESRLKIVTQIDGLLSEFDRQRTFAVPDARREGLEELVLASQRGYSEEESRKRSDARFSGRDPGPVGQCRDDFEQFCDAQGQYLTLGNRPGWLEVELRKVRDELDDKRPVKRGRKSKRREFIISRLASVYEAAGGRVAANVQEAKVKPDGPFVRFVVAIVEDCPPAFQHYVRPGVEHSIRDWWRNRGSGLDWGYLELACTREGMAWSDGLYRKGKLAPI